MRRIWIGLVLTTVSLRAFGGYEPGERSLLSAHNCYPYAGMWADRIDRALGTGYPLSIEQDLCWADHDADGIPSSVIAHNGPFVGNEPSLASHFFERGVRMSRNRSLVHRPTPASGIAGRSSCSIWISRTTNPSISNRSTRHCSSTKIG